MTTEAKPQTVLGAIERRLTDISEQQHALAVEKARLLEQLTPLRLGIVTPDTALIQLKVKGVTLRGLTTARSAPRRPRAPIPKAVESIRPAVSLARRLASESASAAKRSASAAAAQG